MAKYFRKFQILTQYITQYILNELQKYIYFNEVTQVETAYDIYFYMDFDNKHLQ